MQLYYYLYDIMIVIRLPLHTEGGNLWDRIAGLNCNKDNDSAIITAEYCSSTTDDNIDYERCKENQCPANNWIVSVLLVFYTLLTCIMLLNVLIAMFKYVLEKVTFHEYCSVLTFLTFKLPRYFLRHQLPKGVTTHLDLVLGSRYCIV